MILTHKSDYGCAHNIFYGHSNFYLNSAPLYAAELFGYRMEHQKSIMMLESSTFLLINMGQMEADYVFSFQKRSYSSWILILHGVVNISALLPKIGENFIN